MDLSGSKPVPAPTCTIDQEVGQVASGAVTSVSLAADTVLTLTCSNAVGTDVAQTTIAVAVPPVIGSFGASPAVPGRERAEVANAFVGT